MSRRERNEGRGRGERRGEGERWGIIQGLNSMLATSQDLGKLFPAWQTHSPSSPGPCGVAIVAGTVLDPESGRMQLAPGM